MKWNSIINLDSLQYEITDAKPCFHHESAPLATKMGAKKLGFHVALITVNPRRRCRSISDCKY